jgi:hypothetical protein
LEEDMSLQDLYAEVKTMGTLKACIVGQWAATLSEEDKKALDLAIEDDDLSTKDLFLLLRRAGGTFGKTAVRDHRQGDCVCL